MSASATVFEAIRSGDIERLRALVAGDAALAASRDAAGVSAVLQARYHGRADMVEALLAAAPPLDVFEASAVGKGERVRELLAESPDRARAWSADGFTALHLAAFFAQPEIAEMLLARGADADVPARNPMAVRPLHSAVAARQRDIAALLLDRGAQVDARQQGGYTPLHAAAHNGDLTMLDLLLARGADATLRTEDGRDAADLAREKGHEAVLGRLEQRR